MEQIATRLRQFLTGGQRPLYLRAMFSIQKLAVFALIVAAIWLGFRLIGSMDRRRKDRERRTRPSWRDRFMRGGGQGSQADLADVDMVACKACGAYVASVGAGPCGRNDCPYGSAA